MKKERELLVKQEAEAEKQKLIEEKEQAELLAQQEAEEQRLIDEKEQAELLAKKRSRRIKVN